MRRGLRTSLIPLALCVLFSQCSAQSELEVGKAVTASIPENSYKQFVFRPGKLESDTVVYIQVTPTDGDSDLYVSDEGPPNQVEYVWKSNNLGASKAETVAFLAKRPGADLYIAVYGYRGISRSTSQGRTCGFTVVIESQLFDPIRLQSSVPAYGKITPGKLEFFRFDLQATGAAVEEVELAVDVAARTSLASREEVFAIVALDRGGIFSQLRYLAPTDLESQRRLQVASILRGTARVLRSYVDSDASLYVSLSAGLLPAATWEDPTIAYTLTAKTSSVAVQCLPLTHEAPPTQSIEPDEMQFWAVPFPYDDILRIESDTIAGQTELFANPHTFPLPQRRSNHSEAKICGECSISVEARAMPPLATLVQEHAREACAPYAGGGDALEDKYMLLSVRGAAGRTSSYSMSSLALDEECGWRPSCQACAAGGSLCTWCTSRGGHCDTKGSLSEDFGACQQSAWCPADTIASSCAEAASCADCAARADCGWCGRAGSMGVCAPGDSAGPAAGVCDVWAFDTQVLDPISGAFVTDPAAACAVECSVHDAAPDPCSACALEPACGLCASSFGSACIHGDAEGSSDGACPGNRTWWVAEEEACGAMRTPAPDTAIAAASGEPHFGQLTRSHGDGCFLGSCKSAVYEIKVPAGQAQNVRAEVEVKPADAAISFVMMYGGVPSSTSYDLKGARDPEHGGGGALYLVADSVCEEEVESVAYLAVVLEDGAGPDTVEYAFVASVASPPLMAVVDKANTPYTSSLQGQATCCAGAQVYPVVVQGQDTGFLNLNITAPGGGAPASPLRVYARAGTCPSASSFDIMTSNGTLQLEYFQEGIKWFVAVLATGPDPAEYSLALSVQLQDRGGASSGLRDWHVALIGAAVAAAVLIGIAAAAAAVREYYITKRATGYQLSTALVQNSDALASDLEMPTIRLSDPMLLTDGTEVPVGDAKTRALALVQQGNSQEEQELVGLIEGLSSKVVSLEKENKALRKAVPADSPIYVPSQYPQPRSQFASTPINTEEVGLLMREDGPPSPALAPRNEGPPAPAIPPSFRPLPVDPPLPAAPAPAPPPAPSGLAASLSFQLNEAQGFAPQQDLDPPLPPPPAPDAAQAPQQPMARFRVELLCPDGQALLCSHGDQTIGRGMGGITQKKVSREHANLSVDQYTGAVSIMVLGKNPMGVRSSGQQQWSIIAKGERATLRSGYSFSLLVPDQAVQEDSVAFMVLVQALEGSSGARI